MFIVVQRRGLVDTALKTTLKTTAKHRRAIFRRRLPNVGSFGASRNAGASLTLAAADGPRSGEQTAAVSCCCRHPTPYVYTNHSVRTRQRSAVTNYRQLDLTKNDRGCREDGGRPPRHRRASLTNCLIGGKLALMTRARPASSFAGFS